MSMLSMDVELAQRNHAVEVIGSIEQRLHADHPGRILCSRDASVVAVQAELTNLIPAEFAGVTRVFMPFAPVMPSDGTGRFSAYTSRLSRGATVAEHSLVHADHALKVVISGSITFQGQVLTAGDWLWIPGGKSYSFTAEKFGAVVFTVLPCVGETSEVDPYLGSFIQIDEVDAVLKRQAASDFITSRDPGLAEAISSLRDLRIVAEQADGVEHRVLPFAPHMPVAPATDGRFFAWMSLLEPHTRVPRHSHPLERIADFKVVVNGSIHSRGRELTAGDWLWAPTDGSYEFTAGESGALLLAGWPWN
jgi:quercetin dioxygenase-like cupin family protein